MADTLFEDFSTDVETRWDYVSDTVMGGRSKGQVEVLGNGADAELRLTGRVSTENNGGFIQVRRRFVSAWPKGAKGLSLSVRGNGKTYYVFLKTPALRRVWFSYRASFVAGPDWTTIQLPFEGFKPSHDRMPATFAPSDVTSLGIVAYGADFDAEVSVKSIALF